MAAKNICVTVKDQLRKKFKISKIIIDELLKEKWKL